MSKQIITKQLPIQQENIVYRTIESLQKLKKNPRTISGNQLQSLMSSIKRNPNYFHAHPLILSDRTGTVTIIAGNQRYEAATRLGYESVPTVLLKNLSEEEEREITIRDNVSSGEWDYDTLEKDWEITNDEREDWGMLDLVPVIEEEEDIEVKQGQKRDLEEKKKIYDEAMIKQIVLYFEKNDYEHVINRLDSVYEILGVSDNSGLFMKVIDHVFENGKL